MADFCSICTVVVASGDMESTNIGDILMNYRLLQGGDIKIDEIFENHIKPNLQAFLDNELYGTSVGGICEHCGLSRLTLKKEDDKIFLVAWCHKYTKENETGKYKIAIVTPDMKLEYQPEEIEKYFDEN